MSAAVNGQMIHRFLSEVMQAGKTDLIPEFVSEDFVDRTAMLGAPDTGHESVAAYVHAQDMFLSDRQINVIRTVADEETVAVLTVTTGMPTGELAGMPPSGEKLDITFLHMLRVKDGKFVEHWGFGDLIQRITSVAR